MAAYFAFSGPKSSSAAIYVYLEMPDDIKSYGNGFPAIRTLGPYLRTHRRHFRQKSTYTICGNYLKNDFENSYTWCFSNHESAFELSQSSRQDLLWKFIIPADERRKVLARLDESNLNAYSLFGSEESLMDTLAYREIDLKSLLP